MDQHDDATEPAVPLIPPRNPLRDSPFFSMRRRSIQTNQRDKTAPSSPAAQTIFDEIDREIEETQQRLVSAVYTSRTGWGDSTESSRLERGMSDSVARPSSLSSRFSLGGQATVRDEDTSQASTSSSLTDDLKRYSASLDFGKILAVSNDVKEENLTHANNPTTRLRRSELDDVNSLSTLSNYNDTVTTIKVDEEDELEEAQVDAWLQRGSITNPPEHDRFSQSSKARSRTNENPRSPLQIFSPISPSTGKRKYSSPLVAPLSPLSNGRDAYGNFIPTNTRDYFTAQSPPMSPSLQPILEEVGMMTQNASPKMRGGGNWWNPLGIGSLPKEPSPKPKSSSIRPRSSQRNNPGQSLWSKASVNSEEQVAVIPRGTGASSYVGTGPSTPVSPARDRRSIVADDWSDKSDEEHLETNTHPPYQPGVISNNPIEPQFGSVQDRRSQLPRQVTPTSPTFSPRPNTSLKGPSTVSDSQKHELLALSKKRSVLELDDLWSTVSSTRFPDPVAGRPETPISHVSYAPRLERRWNTGPGVIPPRNEVLPPPPQPPHPKSSEGSAILKEQLAYNYQQSIQKPIQYHTHQQRATTTATSIRSPSPSRFPPPTPFSASTWDFASLALGESVSVYNPKTSHIRHYTPIAADLSTIRARAQTEFRDLCHAIMTQYSAEIARSEHDLAVGSISQVQFEHQVRFMIGNKNKALRHSAERTGYTILSAGDEDGILEAMESEDGYAIYRDLFRSTKPELWARLEARYRAVMREKSSGEAKSDSIRSRESSFEAARYVAGKIARFVLAVPEDEGVKTFSKRGMGGVVFSPMGMPIIGDGDGGGGEVWRRREKKKKTKKDKGKGKLVGPAPGDAVYDISGRFTKQPTPQDSQQCTSPNDHDAVPTISAEEATSQVLTDVTIWPINDGEGNWYNARRIGDVIIRGGGGAKEKKVKKVKQVKVKKEIMHAWATANPERGMAMHYLA